MAGAHTTMWIACRMPDWLNFGNFDLVSKQIEMGGARLKCFGDCNARIEMDRNRSKWIELIEIDRTDRNRSKWRSKWPARNRNTKQMEIAGARSKCFGDFDARMNRNGSK
jgi:hypothetical protein